jgi:hypothetical protein
MSEIKYQATITLEDVYALLVDVHALAASNAKSLNMFENKLSDLENKLPGAVDQVMGNPLLKPFLKMVIK